LADIVQPPSLTTIPYQISNEADGGEHDLGPQDEVEEAVDRYLDAG